MSDRGRCVVVGGSGFIGSAVVRAMPESWDVEVVPAPRLTTPSWADDPAGEALRRHSAISALASRLVDADVVVNAAGVAAAAGRAQAELLGANAVLPRVVREAAVAAGARRFIHVSSAGVQGRRPVLDESTARAPISPYTASKALGEVSLRDCDESVIYRPTSVQGVGRVVTARLAQLARSRVAAVAGDGLAPTPQVLVENVGAACAHLVVAERVAPIVLHPWEGLTVASLLVVLGGKEPRHLSERLVDVTVWAAYRAAVARPELVARVRRIDMLTRGQRQQPGWFDAIGWVPPHGTAAWERLALLVEHQGMGATLCTPW